MSRVPQPGLSQPSTQKSTCHMCLWAPPLAVSPPTPDRVPGATLARCCMVHLSLACFMVHLSLACCVLVPPLQVSCACHKAQGTPRGSLCTCVSTLRAQAQARLPSLGVPRTRLAAYLLPSLGFYWGLHKICLLSQKGLQLGLHSGDFRFCVLGLSF